MLTLGVIFFSISEHSFILTAASKLYMVRTNSEKIFKNVEDFESKIFLKSGILSNVDSTEIKKHKVIKLDLMQSLKLFVSRKCKSVYKNRFYNLQSNEVKKLEKLYCEAEHKIYHDLNVVRLIKSLKDMKILIDSQVMDRKIKFKIDHSKKNVINIDSSVCSHSSDSIRSDFDNKHQVKALEKWVFEEKMRMLS